MSTRMHHLARKYKKFPGGACPQTPLAVGAFGTSLCHIRLPLLKILATALHCRFIWRNGATGTQANPTSAWIARLHTTFQLIGQCTETICMYYRPITKSWYCTHRRHRRAAHHLDTLYAGTGPMSTHPSATTHHITETIPWCYASVYRPFVYAPYSPRGHD